MATLRIASVNGEWMNNWFTSDGQPAAFVPSFKLPGETLSNSTDKTASKLAAEIIAIKADVLAVEEAPSRKEELDLFVSQYLSGPGGPTYQTILGDSGGAQKLAVLYKSAAVTAALAPGDSITTLLDPWEADPDGDMILEPYQFTRTPLVIDLRAGPHPFQLIVMHTKSNFVNAGQAMWNDPARRQQYVIAALKARRRNATEGMRTRQYIDERLAVDKNARIIVLGDLNDGPGMDYFEERYLAHNVTDILVGSAFEPERTFAHAQHDVSPDKRFTAIFDDFVPTLQKGKKLLLDHILLSPGFDSSGGLRRKRGSGTVHHAEYEAQLKNQGKKREDRPSDHRPVSVLLRY
jgi:Endonuclease/Exonuclease/phosphatase family